MGARRMKNLLLFALHGVLPKFAIGILLLMLNLLFVANLRAETFKVTAYCSCEKCCDKAPSNKWYGVTASGKKVRWGTVAVDRDVIRFGSRLRVEGFPNTTFRAEDVGGTIKGNHIDLWFPNHKEALKFGVQKREVYNVGDRLLQVLVHMSYINNSG